jgi:putative ABC transport system permease protein
MPLSFILASRNLFHDRLRFVATMVGIVFSVVLVMVQMGLYLGFGDMVTKMINHASGDLWVVRDGTKCFEDPSLLNANAQGTIAKVNGVADVSTLLIGFSDWRLPSGELTPVFIVGSDVKNGTLEPWNIVAGSKDALAAPDSVAVDLTYKERLGVSKLGETANIRGRKVNIAALTNGIRSFTTTPYVFTELTTAQNYIGIPKELASYFVVRLKAGADIEQVRSDIAASVPKVEVLSSAQFAERSRSYWLFSTGAGAALFAGALLGVIVGTVIVAQTLYSSTKDHLDEFATLRAIGSSKRYIYIVIIYQALLNAVIGFCIASLIGGAVVYATREGALPVIITPGLMVAIFAITLVMCIASAMGAILRVVRLDPAMVFTR